jgi:hypothetical protein
VRTLRRALELNPNFALAHAQLGAPLAHLGAHREVLTALSTPCGSALMTGMLLGNPHVRCTRARMPFGGMRGNSHLAA